MKIAIANVQAPFVWGGAEFLAESLAAKLTEAGHSVEQIRVPFKWYPETSLLKSMLACRLLRLDAGHPQGQLQLKYSSARYLWRHVLGGFFSTAIQRVIKGRVARQIP